MCQSNLFEEICRNAWLGQKNLERVGKNEKRHVLFFIRINYYNLFIKFNYCKYIFHYNKIELI
jgi:hypothetical protein